MAHLALNKSSLTRESRQLGTYERFLPSLDLKRKQVIAERNKTRRELREIERRKYELEQSVEHDLPMVSEKRIDLTGLVRVRNVDLGEENVVGSRLPVLNDVELVRAEYSFLVRPHWVDNVAELLEKVLTLRIRTQVYQRRLDILELAVKKITQRVNLFDKVLIPRTRNNIKRIKIQLSDTERAAVVNAKIAKRKRAR